MNYQRKEETVVDPLAHFSLTRDQHRQAQEFNHTVQLEIKLQNTGEEPESFFTEITRCTRILTAKGFNQKEALESWKKWIQWRATKKPYAISEDQIKENLLTRKSFYFKRDREGCPCFYIIMNRIDPKVKPEIDLLFGIYCLELGCKLADQEGPGQLNVIMDMNGYSRKNMASNSAGIFIELLQILQNNYPERLRRLLVLNSNWMFKILYAALKPFMSQRTKDKFFVTNDHKILHEFIDKDNILTMHGGNSTWEYKWPPEKEIQIEEKSRSFEVPMQERSSKLQADLEIEEEEKGEVLNIGLPDKNIKNRNSAGSNTSSSSRRVHLGPSTQGHMVREGLKQKKETIFEGDIYYDCGFTQSGFYQGGLNTDSDLIPFEKFE